MEAAAPSLRVDVMAAPVHSTVEFEATLARLPGQSIGLIISSSYPNLGVKLIVETVARYRLPAIYVEEVFMTEGGSCTTLVISRNSSGSHRSTSIASSRAPSPATCSCDGLTHAIHSRPGVELRGRGAHHRPAGHPIEGDSHGNSDAARTGNASQSERH